MTIICVVLVLVNELVVVFMVNFAINKMVFMVMNKLIISQEGLPKWVWTSDVRQLFRLGPKSAFQDALAALEVKGALEVPKAAPATFIRKKIVLQKRRSNSWRPPELHNNTPPHLPKWF